MATNETVNENCESRMQSARNLINANVINANMRMCRHTQTQIEVFSDGKYCSHFRV